MTNRFIAIIPARYSSTRFPGKPLAMIGQRSMIAHVYDQASKVFDRVIVATDDRRIADHVAAFGGIARMTCSDHHSGTDRVAEVAEAIGALDDIIVNIQGDEPFIAVSQLEQIKSLFDDPQCDIATLAKPFDVSEDIFNPNSVKALFSQSGDAIYFSRWPVPYMRGVDQGLWVSRHTYYKHVGLYGYRGGILRAITRLAPSAAEECESLEQLRWIENGYRVKVGITHQGSYGIDTPADLVEVVARFSIKG